MDEPEIAIDQPPEKVEMEIVYILSNPSMPGIIKIGRTSNLDARVAVLSSASGVPEPFEVCYAAYVEDAAFVERALHAAFSMHRMPGREFFRIPSLNAIAALSLAEIEQVSLNSDVERPSPIVAEIRQRGRRKDPRILLFVENFTKANGCAPSGSDVLAAFPGLPVSTAYDYAMRARIKA